jgi:hypothetical protein
MLASELRAALEAVAAYREAALGPLLPALAAMTDKAQSRWVTWRRRQAHADQLPEQFLDALRAVAAFTDPVLDDGLSDGARWNPTRRTWE